MNPTQALKNRGWTDQQFEQVFSDSPTSTLVELLSSTNAQERTAAAKLLSNKKNKNVIQALGIALTIEQKLYPKLAICNALVIQGNEAVPYLIPLVGKIGHNQYHALPTKLFAKKNYPLPRDIVARTIIRFGALALPQLEQVLATGKYNQITEAIDAIGYIAFYSCDQRSLPALKQCLKKYANDELVTWKIIRAFESYPDRAVKKYLTTVIQDTQKNEILRTEAKRSLKQLGL